MLMHAEFRLTAACCMQSRACSKYLYRPACITPSEFENKIFNEIQTNALIILLIHYAKYTLVLKIKNIVSLETASASYFSDIIRQVALLPLKKEPIEIELAFRVVARLETARGRRHSKTASSARRVESVYKLIAHLHIFEKRFIFRRA